MDANHPVWDVSADRKEAVYRVGSIQVGRVRVSQFGYLLGKVVYFGEAFVSDDCGMTINSGSQGPFDDINEAMLRVMEVYPEVLKRIGDMKLVGTCTSCNNNPMSKVPRPCPYDQEVNKDEKLCSCCDDCRSRCQDNI